MTIPEALPETGNLERLEQILERNLARLEQARPFAKLRHQSGVLDICRRLLAHPQGVERLYRVAPRLDAAGRFFATDRTHIATLGPEPRDGTRAWDLREWLPSECRSKNWGIAPPAAGLGQICGRA